jgi:hypothetical protein
MPKIKLPRKIRDPVKKANGGCGEAAFKLRRSAKRFHGGQVSSIGRVEGGS